MCANGFGERELPKSLLCISGLSSSEDVGRHCFPTTVASLEMDRSEGGAGLEYLLLQLAAGFFSFSSSELPLWPVPGPQRGVEEGTAGLPAGPLLPSS
eukprot:3047807-Pleurochrysis_carterae.AAC.2